jgi:aminoglycoside phosphotransferase family enzyme/predicted kinase
MPDDQRDTIGFLTEPSSYGPEISEVEPHETHVSMVFLAGDYAYKLKRAVTYAYLDFSTVEQRRRACEAELTLNRRTAPELYLGVQEIRRRPDGRLGWGEDGETVDWLVVMRRFPQDRRLDAVAGAEGLNPPLLHALAAHIAGFHAKAECRRDHGGAAALAEIVRENDACLRGCRSIGFSDRRIRELHDRSNDWVRRVGGLLDQRRADGKVRRCHGDLHLRNICVLDGKPVLFDCLEFSEEFASIDVLYDLAFLLMDLEHQGQPESNRVFNRYLDLTGEDDGLAALPFFIALRAAIRAHVTVSVPGQASAGQAAEARRYLDEACAALRPPPARLIAIGGLSGTGKSTIAAAVAAELGARPGARVLRSDVIRKHLFGLDPETRLAEDAYAADVTGRVYEAICTQASMALCAGYCAIIDAVALKNEERQSFANVARRAGLPFTGLWLEAPGAALMARVEARTHDASDATREIVTRQLLAEPGELDWERLDAGKDPSATVAAVRKSLGQKS